MLYFDGRKLKAARRRVGYTQRDLARLIGANVRTYQKWEEGAAAPNATYFLRLVMVLRKTSVLAFASDHKSEEDAADE